MIEGMLARGYPRDFAERCFRQIEGFGTYGFPESHAASFALLVYVSAWLKCRYPTAFACALLNSQPMGFYAPAQIVRDAREHGVVVRSPDVSFSQWDCTLEGGGDSEDQPPALRLGFRLINGLAVRDVERLIEARGTGWRDAADLWRRTGLPSAALATLGDLNEMYVRLMCFEEAVTVTVHLTPRLGVPAVNKDGAPREVLVIPLGFEPRAT